MARIAAIGFRRVPQPPTPMVMPLRSSLTSSSNVSLLSAMVSCPVLRSGVVGADVGCVLLLGGVGFALLDEGRALLVGHPGYVELVGEPLLKPVAGLHVDGVDAVERLLGPPDDGRALGGDLGRHPVGRVHQLVRGYDLEHRAVMVQLGRGGRL